MLERMNDVFIIGEMMASFEEINYYAAKFDKEEISDVSDFLEYVEATKGVRLPLIPVVCLWSVFMLEKMECDCRFDLYYKDEFIKKLEDWVVDVYNRCYV